MIRPHPLSRNSGVDRGYLMTGCRSEVTARLRRCHAAYASSKELHSNSGSRLAVAPIDHERAAKELHGSGDRSQFHFLLFLPIVLEVPAGQLQEFVDLR
jgi:hypothetical protein